MSGLLMGLVYYYQFTPRQQKILLALADHGKDDGTSIHPSIDTLAWKTGSDRRNVQKAIRSLEEMQVLVPVAYTAGGRGHATEYEMHLEAAPLRTSPPPASGMQRIYNLLKGGDSATVYEQEEAEKGGDSATVSQNGRKGWRSTQIKGGDPRIKGGDPRIKGGAIATPTINNHSNNHHGEPAHTREASLAEKENEQTAEPEADPPPLRDAPPNFDGRRGEFVPLTFSEFQRAYRREHGTGQPYAKIHTAYSTYLAEFDAEEVQA